MKIKTHPTAQLASKIRSSSYDKEGVKWYQIVGLFVRSDGSKQEEYFDATGNRWTSARLATKTADISKVIRLEGLAARTVAFIHS